MRKCFIFLTVVAMLFGTLLVSCNQDAKIEDSLNTVRISFPESRGVTSSVVSTIPDVDGLYWYYVATKTDAGLYAHGQTTWKSIDEFEEGADLGAFSQGSWSFSFYGFADETPYAPVNKSSAAIYYAENIGVTIDNADVYVNIALTAGKIDDGKITFKDLSFDLEKIPAVELNGEPSGKFRLVVTEGMTNIAQTEDVDYVYDEENKTISFLFGTSDSKTIEEIASGSHTYTFTVYFKPATGTPSDFYDVAHQDLTVTVNKGLEFTFTGDVFMADPLNDVYIGEITGSNTAKVSVVDLDTTKEFTLSANVSPASLSDTSAVSSTSVTFAGGSIGGTTGSTVVLDTKVYDAANPSTESHFIVSDGSGIVNSIDLSLLVDGSKVTTFTEYQTVETYIAKNLSDVVLTYDGEATEHVFSGKIFDTDSEVRAYKDEDPDLNGTGYCKTTGLLIFKTKHFSSFGFSTTDEYLNVNKNKAYANAVKALGDVAVGDTLLLLKNASISHYIYNKEFTIDMNDKVLSGGFALDNARVTLTNGVFNETGSVYLYGKKTSVDNYSVLTVASDAVVNAGNKWAIILWPCEESNEAGYGVVLNVYGTINAEGHGDAIFVTGNCVGGNSVINVYAGAVICAESTGIALNGVATVNVKEGAAISSKTASAIEVRAGELNIAGGNFSSEATPTSFTPNGSGTTSVGTAVGIAQHTTQLPINVNISGGVFEAYTPVSLFDVQENGAENLEKINVSISGGKFVSRAEENACAIDIRDFEKLGSCYIGSDVECSGAVYPSVVNETKKKTYSSLKAAVDDAATSDTLSLLSNCELDSPVTIEKSITVYGNGRAISGSSIKTRANVTFSGLTYSKPTNAANNASMFYGDDGTEELVFENCTFKNPQWEVIQYTSNSQKKLVVNNCTFEADDVDGAASSYGNTANQAVRYIHIQPSAVVENVSVVITNNMFKDCDSVVDSICGLYFIEGSITIGHNTFEFWADGDVVEGKSAKLSIHWPENEGLKEEIKWTGAIATYTI